MQSLQAGLMSTFTNVHFWFVKCSLRAFPQSISYLTYLHSANNLIYFITANNYTAFFMADGHILKPSLEILPPFNCYCIAQVLQGEYLNCAIVTQQCALIYFLC
jgi:hypothetical protein